MKCEKCINWQRNKGYDDGKCYVVLDKMTIDVTSGWEGHNVNFAETEKDFGCNLFEGELNG